MSLNLFGRSEEYAYTPAWASTKSKASKANLIRMVPFVLVAVFVICGTFSFLYHTSNTLWHTQEHNWPAWVDTTNPAEYLKTAKQPLPVPGADDSLLMLKTGAQVIWQRLPIHMIRLKEIYAPNRVIYSGVDEVIQGEPVIDVLANVSQKLQKHDQFKTYHTQKELYQQGVLLSDAKIPGGWDLDKFKFIPMYYHAYKTHPNMKWYIFYEADSFCFWNALNRWLLANFDHNVPWYMGSRNILGGTLFGHGGSGVVVSNAAMKMTFEEPFNMDEWDDAALKTCCGDALIAEVMAKKGVKMWSEPHARFQGEQTWGIRHQPSEWCEPIFTLHHLKPNEVSMLHEWEKTLDPSKPILYRDLYEKFVHNEISELKTDWNNLSEGAKIDHASLRKQYANNKEVQRDDKGQPNLNSACRLKCSEQKDCFQWQVTDKECIVNNKFRLGQKKEGVTSGWMMDRINHLRESSSCRS
ncbi:hypothetical protein TWF694_001027 [Orbilia ellipsospora]|uniref:Glycosyltransferase family 31 protein n=1 Tax=Orbilia ellipsospora TaxID=2528407 RepID=A0AAV9XTT1_9PEZI